MKKLLIGIILINCILGNIVAEEKQVFMVYGNDFMVNIPLPEYWQVDMDFAAQNRINGFFYIDDYGIQNSPVGIILSLVTKPSNKSKLSEYIEWDKNYLLNNYKNYTFTEIVKDSNQSQKYGYEIIIYEFRSNTGNEHYQNIAYIDCKSNCFIKIYIDCKIKDGTESYIRDFIASAYEINFMNITLQKK